MENDNKENLIQETNPKNEQETLQENEEITPQENGEITLQETQPQDPQELVSVRPVKFQQFEKDIKNRTIKKNLDILQDVSMHVSVELGRTKSSIKEVMDLEAGSIVELDKIAGEQVEIFVNEKLVAKGEVIVIEDKFGVRITSTSLNKNQT